MANVAETRTEEQWWAWHDADAERWSGGEPNEATAEAERRCAAWVAGESNDGPAGAEDDTAKDLGVSTYRIVILSGDAPREVDLDGYDTEDAAQAMADDMTDRGLGTYRVEEVTP